MGKWKGTSPAQDLAKTKQAQRTVLKTVEQPLNDQFQAEITAVQWDWPNPTGRKNGTIVDSPRDIVDLGNLRDSQQIIERTDSSITWQWTGTSNRNYAQYVHDGAVFKDGTSKVARPWTKTAERQLKLDKFIEDILRRELDG